MTREAEPPEPGTLAVEFKDVPWTPSDAIPHRHRLTYHGAYRAAIPAEISERAFPLDPHLVELLADATAEIARFDAEAGHLDIAPLPAILLRTESVASSRIEQLTASAKAIALAELGDTSRQNARTIVANVRAMQAAIALADRLDEQAILDMHTALLEGEHPEWCGRWRDQQVWIGGTTYGPHTAAFVPPAHRRVPTAMDDLVRFLGRTDLPPLSHAAIAYAQFETIHPFPDGNGRTGRALVHSLLRHRALTRTVTVPISAGLLTDNQAHFAALSSYRAGDHAAIVEQFAHASHRAVFTGRTLVADLSELRNEWAEALRGRRSSTAHRVADLLLRYPAVDSKLVETELSVSTPTALAALSTLEGLGILREVTQGKWGRKWVAPGVLSALDRFSESAGRRTR